MVSGILAGRLKKPPTKESGLCLMSYTISHDGRISSLQNGGSFCIHSSWIVLMVVFQAVAFPHQVK